MTRPALAVATHRLGLATLAATGVLIAPRGLVTNTGAGLAVPDWPSTFGHNLFLFPWSQMTGGIFYEHSHRLVGALVGLLTLLLSAALWCEGGRLRRLGLVAVAVAVVQGVLGGLKALTVVAAALSYVQIVFGALLTHAGRLDLHLAGAVLVFVVMPLVAAQLRRTGDAVAAPLASRLLALLGIQLILGAGSFLARFSSLWIPAGQTTVVFLPVAHRLIGSLILGAAVALAVRVWDKP
jgi:heme A synthase